MRKKDVSKRVCSVFMAAAMLLTTNAVSASAADSGGLVSSKYSCCVVPKANKLGGDFIGLNHFGVMHFAKKGIVGCGLDRTEAENCFNIGNNTAYTEMYFGFRAEIKNGKVIVTNYNNVDYVTYEGFKIQRSDGTEVTTIEQASDLSGITIDLDQKIFKKQGIFAITGYYKSTTSKISYACNLYLYIDSDKKHTSYICYGRDDIVSDQTNKDRLKRQRIDEPYIRAKNVIRAIKAANLTPEDCLDSNIGYPANAPNEECYDTKYWQDKSDEIIKHYNADKKSDAFKATIIHDWMTRHLSYDNWKAKNLVYPRYTNDYGSPGKYYISQTKCGVCYDFTHIFAIMCRQQNVPCVMFANDTHGWNAIYLDGEWLEIDITTDVEKKCNTKNFSDIPEKTYQNSYCYEGFCNFDYCYPNWNDIEVMEADYF